MPAPEIRLMMVPEPRSSMPGRTFWVIRIWEKTFAWFVEEVGELARGLHRGDDESLREEFADVAAWLVTLASIRGIDMGEAARKYANGCPRCGETPCSCD